MEKIVILRGPTIDTAGEDLLAECLKTLFPGCEIRVSVGPSDDGPLVQYESLI